MIDWKRRALDLVTVVWEGDLEKARRYAAGLRQLEDLETQTQVAFFNYIKNQDRKKTVGMFDDYLALVRLTNETAERIDQEVDNENT